MREGTSKTPGEGMNFQRATARVFTACDALALVASLRLRERRKACFTNQRRPGILLDGSTAFNGILICKVTRQHLKKCLAHYSESQSICLLLILSLKPTCPIPKASLHIVNSNEDQQRPNRDKVYTFRIAPPGVIRQGRSKAVRAFKY